MVINLIFCERNTIVGSSPMWTPGVGRSPVIVAQGSSHSVHSVFIQHVLAEYLFWARYELGVGGKMLRQKIDIVSEFM